MRYLNLILSKIVYPSSVMALFNNKKKPQTNEILKYKENDKFAQTILQSQQYVTANGY